MDSFQTCPNHPEVTAGLINCARCGRAFCPDCVVDIGGKPYDAACKDEQVRDLQSGVAAGANLASRWARFGGALVDAFIGWVVNFVTTLLLVGTAATGSRALGTLTGVAFVPLILMFVYEGALTANTNGQTLGKMAASSRIVRLDGSPISAGQAWGRVLARYLIAFTIIGGIIDPLMVFSSDNRTLHDRLAGTRVVKSS